MYDPISVAVVAGMAISAGTGVYGAIEAKEEAKKQKKLQRQQAELQRRIETARTKRLQRIRQAQLLATTGAAGITGAVVEAPIIAGGVQEQAQTALIREQTELQKEQFGIQAAQTAAEAEVAIGQAIGTFAAGVGEVWPAKPQTTPLVPIGPEGPVR